MFVKIERPDGTGRLIECTRAYRDKSEASQLNAKLALHTAEGWIEVEVAPEESIYYLNSNGRTIDRGEVLTEEQRALAAA